MGRVRHQPPLEPVSERSTDLGLQTAFTEAKGVSFVSVTQHGPPTYSLYFKLVLK